MRMMFLHLSARGVLKLYLKSWICLLAGAVSFLVTFIEVNVYGAMAKVDVHQFIPTQEEFI